MTCGNIFRAMMTPKQFRTARLSLGINKHQLARFFGRSVRTITNYEMTQPDPLAAKVLSWMVNGQCPLPRNKNDEID